jgi:DNA-binding LacI/PurR family transcriptional regulator
MRKTPPTPKPMGNVTIKDIADHLGISHSTVSRALADHPYTNEDTKLRVRAAVDELGYVPHAAARGLRQDRATLVGLILPELQNELAVVTAQTIAGHCLKAGLQMVLAVTGDDPQVEYQHVMALRQARARGIIITASPGMYGKTVDLLQRVPTTQFSRRHPLLTAPSVAVDGEQGVFVATQHLLQLGHTRIAYVGMDVDKSTGAERLAGYVRAHKQANTRMDPGLQRLGPPYADFGRAATGELMHMDKPPTALVLGAVSITMGGLMALRHGGLEAPRDVSLVGFGDPSWYALWSPGITAIGLPMLEMAEATATLLMRQPPPDGQAETKKPVHIKMEPRFLVRGTTAPLSRKSQSKRRA